MMQKHANDGATPVLTDFRRSRIYAEGWNAARQLSLTSRDDPQSAGALNPYPSEPERARWNEGFAGAAL